MSAALPKAIIESWKRGLLRPSQSEKVDLPLEATVHKNVMQLGSELRKIWTTYTSERKDLRRGLLGHPKSTSAYLAGFHLANCARAWNILQRSASWTKPDQVKSVNIVDLGCGTGAMAATAQQFFQNAEANITLIDNTAALLDKARETVQRVAPKAKIRGHKSGIESLSTKLLQGNDEELLVLCFGYVLNELTANPRAQKNLGKILEQAQKRPTLILALEPANQSPSRDLMAFRDQLSTMGWSITYPCPTARNCPMLERRRDWCYSEFAWTRPGLQKKIDRLMGVERNKIATCGFMFSNILPVRPDTSVVVGKPLDNKTQKMRLLLCNQDGTLSDSLPQPDQWYARGMSEKDAVETNKSRNK